MTHSGTSKCCDKKQPKEVICLVMIGWQVMSLFNCGYLIGVCFWPRYFPNVRGRATPTCTVVHWRCALNFVSQIWFELILYRSPSVQLPSCLGVAVFSFVARGISHIIPSLHLEFDIQRLRGISVLARSGITWTPLKKKKNSIRTHQSSNFSLTLKEKFSIHAAQVWLWQMFCVWA